MKQAVRSKQERYSPYSVDRGSSCSSADGSPLRSPAVKEQFWEYVVSVAMGLCFKSVGSTAEAIHAAQSACCSSGIGATTDPAALAALGEAEQLMARTIQLVQLTHGLVVEHAARRAGLAAPVALVPPATAAFVRRLQHLLAAKMAQHVAAANATPQCLSDDADQHEACSPWRGCADDVVDDA